jgi:hypothetical protein
VEDRKAIILLVDIGKFIRDTSGIAFSSV